MAKLRRTPRYFQPVPRAKGRVTYKWEPSATLRALGHTTVMLGDHYVTAITKAEALNAELDAWRAGASGHEAEAKPIAPANRFHATWADLDRAFRFDEKNGLLALKPKSQKEYNSRMKWLKTWAENGRTRLSHIDRDMAKNLRNQLVSQASPFKAKAILRIFSVLMTYAENVAQMIPMGSDPSKRLKVPEPPRRSKAIAFETMEYLAATARDEKVEGMALAIELGFLCVQRMADWTSFTRLHWREMRDIDPADRAVLCGPDGKVFGVRFRQGKTTTWIGNAVHNELRLRVEARIADMHARGFSYILFDDGDGTDPDGHWHERQFNRVWNSVKARALKTARDGGDNWLCDQIEGTQYRDLRRSGMCWMRDMGATKEQIAARSGHSIEEVEDILKTYMPANERGSAAAFALAYTASKGRKQERNEG